jgi:hypothetical protein
VLDRGSADASKITILQKSARITRYANKEEKDSESVCRFETVLAEALAYEQGKKGALR